jgi:peptidyl-tRNA hydrolase
MSSINQTILIRTDLFDLSDDVGLMSAQIAHIHFQGTRYMIQENLSKEEGYIGIKLANEVLSKEDQEAYMEWVEDPYILVKQIPNAEALVHFQELANEAKLPVYIWTDTVYVRLSATQKKAFPNTLVGMAIGPTDADKIRTVVGDLPLL